MVESRGGVEDEKLKDSYRRLYANGTDPIPSERWQERMTSSELKVKPKSADIAGLQLADLIAHPSRREILLANNLIMIKKIGMLSKSDSGWAKQLNLISWNDRDPKYDIREWSPEDEKMGKGITLSKEELVALKELLNKIEL